MLDSTRKINRFGGFTAVLLLSACIVDAPPPQLGDCAVPPEDRLSWEFGEVGIGTCIASPSDIEVRPDPTDPSNHFLFVVNANSRNNFDRSSLLSIDASSIDLQCPVNGMHEVSTSALGMQEFAGRIDFDPTSSLALVTNRHTGAELGDLTDVVFTVDSSDPRDLRFHDAGPRKTGPFRFIVVPADPWSVRFNPWNGRAYILGLTSHVVSALDVVADPLRYVDLYGEFAVSDPVFNDADGSGSSPDFELLAVNEERLRNETVTMSWRAGTTRLYYPGVDELGLLSLHQADSGDGANFIPLVGGSILPAATAPWAELELGSAAVGITTDGTLQGLIDGLDADGVRRIGRIESVETALDWTIRQSPALVPLEAGWDDGAVFDPDFVCNDGCDAWFSGGSGVGWAIGHASGGSLASLVRDGDPRHGSETDGLVLVPELGDFDAAAVFGPAVIQQGDTGEWFLYYTGHSDMDAGPGELPEGMAIGLARSDDGVVFERTDSGIGGSAMVIGPGADGEWDDEGVAMPSVLFDGGRFQLWYQGFDGNEWRTGRALSTDGVTWTKDHRNPVFDGAVDSAGLPRRAFAIKAGPGGYYRVEGSLSGPVGDVAFEGEPFESLASSVLFQVVGGQALGRGDSGTYDASGASSPSAAGDVVLYVARRGSHRTLAAARDVGAGLERLSAVELTGFSGPLEGLVGSEPSLSLSGASLAEAAAGGVIVGFETQGGIAFASGSLESGGGDLSLAAVGPGTAAGFRPGEPGTFDDSRVAAPSLVQDPASGDQWLYYEGWDEDVSLLGRAVSSDGGASWSDRALVLDRGPAGAWDDAALRSPTVVAYTDDEGFDYHLWYVGNDGDTDRIGYARRRAGGLWERYVGSDGVGTWVFDGDGLSFAFDGVSDPWVRRVDDGFELWFTGTLDGVDRLGRARSPDGVNWTPLVNPTTAGDSFVLQTRDGDDDASSGIYLGDGTEQNSRIVDGFFVHGAGASEMVLSPDGRYAVVANKRSASLIVLDLYDDSTDDYLDANYNDIEAIIPVNQEHGMVGFRGLAFSPDATELYALMAPLVTPEIASDAVRFGTEALVRIDWTRVHDEDEPRALREDMVTGFLPTPRGIEEDREYPTEVSVGPSSLTLSPDGRYAYITNFNDNTMSIVDLERGARGVVIETVRGLDENPFDVALSPDGRHAYVANSYGLNRGGVQHSTVQVVDVDPSSERFGEVLTRLSNIDSRSEAGCAAPEAGE